jgi:hypothetical protein
LASFKPWLASFKPCLALFEKRLASLSTPAALSTSCRRRSGANRPGFAGQGLNRDSHGAQQVYSEDVIAPILVLDLQTFADAGGPYNAHLGAFRQQGDQTFPGLFEMNHDEGLRRTVHGRDRRFGMLAIFYGVSPDRSCRGSNGSRQCSDNGQYGGNWQCNRTGHDQSSFQIATPQGLSFGERLPIPGRNARNCPS